MSIAMADSLSSVPTNNSFACCSRHSVRKSMKVCPKDCEKMVLKCDGLKFTASATTFREISGSVKFSLMNPKAFWMTL